MSQLVATESEVLRETRHMLSILCGLQNHQNSLCEQTCVLRWDSATGTLSQVEFLLRSRFPLELVSGTLRFLLKPSSGASRISRVESETFSETFLGNIEWVNFQNHQPWLIMWILTDLMWIASHDVCNMSCIYNHYVESWTHNLRLHLRLCGSASPRLKWNHELTDATKPYWLSMTGQKPQRT